MEDHTNEPVIADWHKVQQLTGWFEQEDSGPYDSPPPKPSCRSPVVESVARTPVTFAVFNTPAAISSMYAEFSGSMPGRCT